MIGPFHITADDVAYTPYPLSHIGPACYDIVPTLMTDGRVVRRDGFSLSNFWPELVRFGVTWFMCLGSVQQLLYAAPSCPEERLHKVTRCWSKPAPVPKADFDRRFGLHLIPVVAMARPMRAGWWCRLGPSGRDRVVALRSGDCR